MSNGDGRQAVRSMIENAMTLATVLTIGQGAVADERIQVEIRQALSQHSFVPFPTRDGSGHCAYLWRYEGALNGSESAHLEAMRSLFSMALVAIGDAVTDHGLNDLSPVMQLLRHVRNACAHGNEFILKKNGEGLQEPVHPARLGDLELTAAMDGQGPVLFDFLMPGDVMDILEAVHDTCL